MGNKSSYRQILKATGILGGVQVVDILIRIVQMKIVAILLGPMGVGVIGLYKSTIDLIRSATGFGLDFSSVREIAQADGAGDAGQINKTTIVMRRWVWFTGLVGMALTILFSGLLSRYAFGDEKYGWGISLISVVLLLMAISGGQLALLQGLRKIPLMAKAKVWGLIVAFIVAVPLYWIFRLDAIVPVIIITAVIVLFFSWYYSRQIRIDPISLSVKDTFVSGLGMVRLGFFMVVSTLVAMASMYIIRAYIANKVGIDGVGQFQAAWSISSLYLTAVLQAMGTDYFPRLSAVSEDNGKVVMLVNEQTEIALLLAGPIVVGMLSFISIVVFILYSSKFDNAIPILHWMLAGTFFKVLSWPLGFIMLAKGRGGIFITTEILSNSVFLLITGFAWENYSIESTGIAYVIMYMFYTLTVLAVGYRISSFIWSKQNVQLIVVFSILIIASLVNVRLNAGVPMYVTGAVVVAVTSMYSLYKLNSIIDLTSIYRKIFNSNG